MSTRNDLLTELEALLGEVPEEAKKLSNEKLEEAVNQLRERKEAADKVAAAEVAKKAATDQAAKITQAKVQDSPQIPQGYKFKHPLQVAPGVSIVCRRGVLDGDEGTEYLPGDGETRKLVAHGKVLTGPGFNESMLNDPPRPKREPPPKPGARRR